MENINNGNSSGQSTLGSSGEFSSRIVGGPKNELNSAMQSVQEAYNQRRGGITSARAAAVLNHYFRDQHLPPDYFDRNNQVASSTEHSS